MLTAALYDRPDLYDLLAPPDAAMERFYGAEVLSRPGPVLELCCGSGRFTLPLARTGRPLVAADLSRPMLKAATDAAAAAGLDIAFLELDMRDFELPGQSFDTIVVTANSLLHLYEPGEFDGFFASVRKALSPHGRLVFHVFAPSVAILSRDPAARVPVMEALHPALGLVSIDETLAYDPARQVSTITWYWSTAEERDFHSATFGMRQLFPQELPLLVERGGMRLVERYGDFDRSPFTATSMHQVCVCAIAEPAAA